MVTITGLPASRASTVSRQIVSDATAEPPGLSTRRTIALTRLSRAAWRIAAAVRSASIWLGPISGLVLWWRGTIAPVAVIMAIVAGRPFPGLRRALLAYLAR